MAGLGMVGVVVGVNSDGSATVNIGTGTVVARLNDATAGVGAGNRVTLLPLDGGYEVISKTTGSSGVQLGPELLANGSFEFASEGQPSGWSTLWQWSTGEMRPTDIAQDAPVDGSNVWRVRATPGFEHNVIVWPTSFRVDPGTPYRVSVWARIDLRSSDIADYDVTLGVSTGATQDAATPFAPGSYSTEIATAVPGVASAVIAGEYTARPEDVWLAPWIRSSASNPALDLDLYLDVASLRRRLTT